MALQRLKEEQRRIRKEVKEKTIGYILGAFGLVAGLAWNEAIKSLIDQFFPANKGSILIKFIYALFITVVVVVTSLYLLKFIEEKEAQK